jgi:hypothetical protein
MTKNAQTGAPRQETIRGQLVTDPHNLVTRAVTKVASILPPEYQEDLDEFRAAIRPQLRIRLLEECDEIRRWHRSEVTGDFYLDVSECNHVPIEVDGHSMVEGQGEVRWQAYLIGLEWIDIGPREPYRRVARYRATEVVG